MQPDEPERPSKVRTWLRALPVYIALNLASLSFTAFIDYQRDHRTSAYGWWGDATFIIILSIAGGSAMAAAEAYIPHKEPKPLGPRTRFAVNALVLLLMAYSVWHWISDNG